MAMVQPFKIAVPHEILERIRAKVAGYTWHEMPVGAWSPYLDSGIGYVRCEEPGARLGQTLSKW